MDSAASQASPRTHFCLAWHIAYHSQWTVIHRAKGGAHRIVKLVSNRLSDRRAEFSSDWVAQHRTRYKLSYVLQMIKVIGDASPLPLPLPRALPRDNLSGLRQLRYASNLLMQER